jgi:tetratricopeptide (TPR) repeat protein
MIPILITFYLTAAVLFCIGYVLSRKKRASTRNESRRVRKSNGHFFMITAALPLALGVITQLYSSNESTTDSSTTSETSDPSDIPPGKDTVYVPSTDDHTSQEPEAPSAPVLIQQAVELLEANHPDEAMNKANAAFEVDPKSWAVYFVRGNIYAEKEQWDQAEKEYQTAIQYDAQNSSIKYNLADIYFMQKKYGAARPGFIALEQDIGLGDLSAYKVFLCDLYGGHVDAASGELETFNQSDANASYYFANAAWCLYQQKTEDAQNWLASATKIFAPTKFKRYASSLSVLGYPDKLDQNAAPPSNLHLTP